MRAILGTRIRERRRRLSLSQAELLDYDVYTNLGLRLDYNDIIIDIVRHPLNQDRDLFVFDTEDEVIEIRCKPQEALVEANPDVFFVPPYVGPSGWIGVEVDGEVDWGVVEGLLEDGYRAVAPRRAIEQLDGDP